METETFQAAHLANLDFEPSQTTQKSVAGIPLPDEMPRTQDYSHLPKEILKSTTVENLISQNEDLMARLKVTLRRLSVLENENQRVVEEANKARLSQSSIKDQLLIWKEKDQMWKDKIDHLEKEKEVHIEKLKALTETLQTLSTELARHEKYHERVRTQVKPYLTQLKEYSRTQEIRIKELEQSHNKSEAQLRDLRHQMIEVTKNSRYQVETADKNAKDLVNHYEEQIQKLETQVVQLKDSHEQLGIKTTRLNTALEKQDALENEVVTLRHSKDEMRHLFDSEIKKQAERISALTRQNQKLGVEHADLQIRVLEDSESVKKLSSEKAQLQEQLEGLRFMWTAKNEEAEKLKAAAAALEKLNMELSKKLNSMRKSDEPAN